MLPMSVPASVVLFCLVVGGVFLAEGIKKFLFAYASLTPGALKHISRLLLT
jgi:hypothetical protein